MSIGDRQVAYSLRQFKRFETLLGYAWIDHTLQTTTTMLILLNLSESSSGSAQAFYQSD